MNIINNLLLIDLKKLDELKLQVIEIIDQKRTVLEDVARYLYENPELGSEEFKAFEKLTSVLEEHGFTIEKGVYDMPTAFVARRRGKKNVPKVAVIAEYDALPGVGHGCGHNLISAAAIGAGIASGAVVEDLFGEILVVGTPAEEGRGPSGGSKIIMANNGFWDDIAGVIMLHPGNAWTVGGQALGISGLSFEFKGQTSHAAASPHMGRNALNAATLAYTATHMVRQEARRDANLVIHGIISEGGLASNIIPDKAVLDLGVRSSEEQYLDEMVERLAKCGEGAAHAMEVEVEITKRKGYKSKKLNIPLIKTLWGNYLELDAPVKDWKDSILAIPLASTDFGDVSQRCPSAGSNIGVTPAGTPGHSTLLADATVTKKGLDAMIIGAKALGMTLVELLVKLEILDEAKEYFDSH